MMTLDKVIGDTDLFYTYLVSGMHKPSLATTARLSLLGPWVEKILDDISKVIGYSLTTASGVTIGPLMETLFLRYLTFCIVTVL